MQSFPNEVLEKLRVHLEEEKKRISVQIEELAAQDPFSDPERARDTTSVETGATDESNHDRFVAMLDESKAKLADIDGALARIGDGTYGYCANCGTMIDTDRLAILPTATLCLTCEQEKKGK